MSLTDERTATHPNMDPAFLTEVSCLPPRALGMLPALRKNKASRGHEEYSANHALIHSMVSSELLNCSVVIGFFNIILVVRCNKTSKKD